MPTAYAALADRLLVVAGTDEDRTPTERLADRRVECVAAHPGAPERVLCGTFDAGLWRSTDGGERFERVGEDAIGSESVMAATASPHDPAELWVGTEPSAVYRSTDGGDTWTERPGLTDLPSASEWYFPPRPHTHHVRWIAVDPADPDRLYVGIEAGALVRTDDAGATWTERPEGARRDNHSLATHPDAPGRVYAAAGDGYAESDDGGDAWRYPQDGLGHRYCWSVRPDPGDPGTVVLSAASGPRAAHTAATAESYVYRRADGGDWTLAMDGLPEPEGLLRPVLATAGRPGEFYALTDRGLYRSTDAGREWSRLPAAWPDSARSETPSGLVVTA